MEHVLYETGDKDAPNSIRDENGEVVLGLCRICGRAEVELDEPCTPWRPIATAPANRQIMLADVNGENRRVYIGCVYRDAGPGSATHWMPLPVPPNSPIR